MSFSKLAGSSTELTADGLPTGQAGSTDSPQAKRSELIALFLAVLHLVKEQLVNVEQGRRFGDMTIAKLTPPPVQ